MIRSKLLFQSTPMPSVDGRTTGAAPSSTISASLPILIVSPNCGSTLRIAVGRSRPAFNPPAPSGSNRSDAAIASGAKVAFLPAPSTVTGADTAGCATSRSACCTPSRVVLTGCSAWGTWMATSSAQWVSTSSAVRCTSMVWPVSGSTATGVAPSKRMVPSAGARSSCGRSCSNACTSCSRSPWLTGATSCVPNSEAILVNGFSG